MSIDSGRVEPQLLVSEASSLDLDLLAIQEVDEGQPRSQEQNQTAEIARAMGADQFRFLPSLTGTPGHMWEPHQEDVSGPRYGIGLITRLPVIAWHELRMRSSRRGMPLLVPTEKGARLAYVDDEPRVALAVELPKITVACVHLSFVPGRNIRQLREVTRWLGKLPGPRLLLGDFNLPGRVPAWSTGWHQLARFATYPAWDPKLQFDHALSDQVLPVLDAQSPRLKVSDHLPLVFTLGSFESTQ